MGGGASLHAGSGAVKAVMVEGKTCEVEGPKELGGGTLDTYFKGLKILSGLPAPNLNDESLYQQMEAEHCYMSGHDSKFECSSHYENSDSSNLKKPETSAREEWEALHQGKTPDSMNGFRSRKPRTVAVYKDKSHTASDSDILSRCERLGLALYTGPMFAVYNGILRREMIPKPKSDILSPFLGSSFGEKFNTGLAVTPSSTYDALKSVYTNAERLLLLIFERFDRNEDLCIQAEEFKDAIDGILQKKMLDDSMMRVVDYFSAVDRNGDGKVEFSEALKHCFPHVPQPQFGNLEKWLHPKKHDVSLYAALSAFAKEVNTERTFDECLASIQDKCKDFIEKQSKQSSETASRLDELTRVDKGYVSCFTAARILLHHHSKNEEFKQKAGVWRDKMFTKRADDVADSQVPNFFSATIFVISSAIQKLSRKSPARPPTLYRGYKDTTVPKILKDGYCEFGFLSASEDPEIAEGMAGDGGAGLMLIIESPMGGCADIKEYSQFPDEKEHVFPPLSYIQFGAQSTPSKMATWQAVVHPSLASTIKDLQEQEKMMHLQLFRFNRSELRQKLELRLKDWLLLNGHSKDALKDKPVHEMCILCDKKGLSSAPSSVPDDQESASVSTKVVLERIMCQYDEVFENHQQCNAADFGQDDFFRQKTAEMLDSKRWCEQKLELWLQNLKVGLQSDVSIGLFFYPLQQSNKFWMSNLRREIMESRSRLEQPASDQRSAELPKLKQLCINLLKAKGFVPATGNIKDQAELLSLLGTASVSGWGEEDLHALLDQHDDIVGIIKQPIPHLDTTCLHLAAAHGCDFFLKTVFKYCCKKLYGNKKSDSKLPLPQDVIHNQGANNHGESPLFLAAENGHASCINVLLQFCPELPVFKLSPLCAAVSRSHVSCVKLLLNKSLINQASNGFTPLMRAVIRCDAEVVKLLLDAGAVEQASGHSSHASSESHDMDLLLRQADCAGKEDKVIAIKSLLEQHRKSKL